MKVNKKLILLLALVIAMTSVLAGCGKKENEPATKEGGETKKEEEANGDEAKMDDEQYLNLFGYEPNTLDSARSSIDTAWIAMAPIFECLTRVEGQEDGVIEIKPGMAESWENNDEGTEYTFHLRDAKWSDGEPVTAQNFEYAMKRVLDPDVGAPYAWLFYGIIKNGEAYYNGEVDWEDVGVIVEDDHTLVFELEHPTPYFMELTYFPVLYPQREDIVEKYGDAYGTEQEQIVCNGPFILSEWVHDSKIVYEKNPEYWDKDNVFIEKIVKNQIEDENARMNAMLAGDIDVGGVSKAEWMEKFDETGEWNYIRMDYPDIGYHMFNCKDKYFKNEKIRKAFAAGFDREALINDVYNGVGVPAWEYVPLCVDIGGENYQDKVGNPQYVKKLCDEIDDPKALLIEGLKEEGLDPDPAKMDVSMMFRGTDEWTKQCAEWYQQQFKESLGVNLKVDLLEYSIAYDKQANDEYQIFDTGWFADYNDAGNFLDFWHSKDGYYNVGWNNEEFDNTIDQAKVEMDNDKRAELYRRAEEILTYEDCVLMAYNHSEFSTYRKKYIQNYYNIPFGQNDFVGVYTSGRP
jgi:oligopeptide transport system substrate-binding protein